MMVEEYTPHTFEFNFKNVRGNWLRTNIYLIGQIISEMRRGYSPIIVIVGKQRSGKSFFAIWLCTIIHNYFHNTKFDPAAQTSYDPLAASEIIDISIKEPILIDEAGAIYNKQDWFEKVTKAMGKEAKIVVSVEEFKRRLEKERKKKADLDAQIAQARANGGKGVAGLEKKRKQSGSVIGAIVTNLKRLNKARGSDHDAEVMD